MESYLIAFLQKYLTIPENDQKLINNGFIYKKYKQGEYLSHAGETCNDLYFINKGLLKITVPKTNDSHVTYYFMKEQQMMGFLYSYTFKIPTVQGLQAVCDSEIYTINLDNWKELCGKLPYLDNAVENVAQLTMAEMVNIKNIYLGCSSLERYKRFLKFQPDIALSAPQSDIASYLGITPQSLSRLRKQLFEMN
jgi:CRP/FNR family transcriptional regulator, anaerobic regulatory protein